MKTREIKSLFTGADEFIYQFTQHRVAYIRGHFGSGKTLLAVALGVELWRLGLTDRIFTNFPMAGRCLDYSQNRRGYVILDEASRVLDSRKFLMNSSDDWLYAMRKRQMYLILPSKTEVDKRFRDLTIQRVQMIANKRWVYRWEISDGVGRLTGDFTLKNPSDIFGLYSTEWEPAPQEFENLKRLMKGSENVDQEEEQRRSEESEKYQAVQYVVHLSQEEEYREFSKPVSLFETPGERIARKFAGR